MVFTRRDAEAERSDDEVLAGAMESLRAAMALRDPYTARHQDRVADLGAAIAARMGGDAALVGDVRIAGLVHDAGKLGCPFEVLTKPRRLEPAEYTLVQAHAAAGWEVVRHLPLGAEVHAAVLQHHERLDGSGYPSGLREHEIGMVARIVAVADVVEAMASHRPYRPALGVGAALSEIERGRGSQYDGDVVDACLALFHEDTYAL